MSMTRQNSFRLFGSSVQPWLICIVGMLFYCYNYFLRVSPGVMEQQLVETFHMTAAKFGALAGLYYWAYMPMQLPAGLLFDRFGSRIVLSTACLTTVLGLSLFVTAESFLIAGGGRFLIGLGTAFSYIGVLKLASLWLPPRRFATVAGLTTATGMTCAALSQKYLTHIVETEGFRHALYTSVTAGVVLIMLIFFIIRSRPKNPILQDLHSFNEGAPPPDGLLNTLRILASNPQMWLIGIIGCLLYLPASVFLDLWGIPWLKTVYHLQPADAVNISSITFFGWIISGPMIGLLSDKIGRRKLPLVIFGGIAALMLCVIFYMPGLTLNTLYTLFFITGFCCGSHPLCFALSKEINSPQIAGTAIAASNMLIMSGGAIFQPLVGKLLDWHAATHNISGKLSIYSAGDYTFALSVIPLGVVLGIFLSLFIREQRPL